jgi:hypothetical protein
VEHAHRFPAAAAVAVDGMAIAAKVGRGMSSAGFSLCGFDLAGAKTHKLKRALLVLDAH